MFMAMTLTSMSMILMLMLLMLMVMLLTLMLLMLMLMLMLLTLMLFGGRWVRGSFEKPWGLFGIALASLLESSGRSLGWPMGGAEQPMGDLSLRFPMLFARVAI